MPIFTYSNIGPVAQAPKRFHKARPSDLSRGQVLDAALELKHASWRASSFLSRCSTYGETKILPKLAEPTDENMQHVEGMRPSDAFRVLTAKERNALTAR